MKPETAPAAEKADNTVELLDAAGSSTGITVRTKDALEHVEAGEDEAPERARLRGIAKSINGWTSFEHDGAAYPFSQDRALVLFQRHPHFADQIETAIKKAST